MSVHEKIGEAVDIATWNWSELPWGTDPANCRQSDWRQVLPGTYFLAKIENGWVYVRQGDRELKLELRDVEARWPRL